MASYRYLKPQTADIIRRSRRSFKRLSTMITCSILALAGVHTFYIVRITFTYGAGARSWARCCPPPRAPTGSVPPHRPRLVRRLVRRLVGHVRLVSYVRRLVGRLIRRLGQFRQSRPALANSIISSPGSTYSSASRACAAVPPPPASFEEAREGAGTSPSTPGSTPSPHCPDPPRW